MLNYRIYYSEDDGGNLGTIDILPQYGYSENSPNLTQIKITNSQDEQVLVMELNDYEVKELIYSLEETLKFYKRIGQRKKDVN